MLIEVAESSLCKDRLVKAEIYAENCAPEYWIVDLASRSVFVHTDPVRWRYRSVIWLSREDALRPLYWLKIEATVRERFRASR